VATIKLERSLSESPRLIHPIRRYWKMYRWVEGAAEAGKLPAGRSRRERPHYSCRKIEHTLAAYEAAVDGGKKLQDTTISRLKMAMFLARQTRRAKT